MSVACSGGAETVMRGSPEVAGEEGHGAKLHGAGCVEGQAPGALSRRSSCPSSFWAPSLLPGRDCPDVHLGGWVVTAPLAGASGGRPDGSVSQGPDRAEHGLPGGAAVLHPEAQRRSGAGEAEDPSSRSQPRGGRGGQQARGTGREVFRGC